MMGSNIALEFEGEVAQLAERTYKEEATFTLYFLYYHPAACVHARLCLRAYVRMGERAGRRKRILEKGNVSAGRGRSVPADRSIRRDFKADCPYKVKNFFSKSK